MRAKEFIVQQKVDEVAPFVAALGGALARGAATAGSALARGAGNLLAKGGQAAAKGISSLGSKIGQSAADVGGKVAQGISTTASQIGKQAINSVGSNIIRSIGSSSSPTAQPQQKSQPVGPTTIPSGTKIEVVPSKDPNKISIKIDGASVDLDMNKPENKQLIQQLGQLKV